MRSFLEKGLFVLSVAVLTFLLGFAVRWHNWFPNALLERASRQATAQFESWSEAPPALEERAYDHSGTRTMHPDSVQPGLTLLTSSWKTKEKWKPGLKLIDENGTVLHSWLVDKTVLFPDSVDRRGNPELKTLHGAHLFPNGDVLMNLEYVGTVRLNACGEVQWRLPAGTHHAIHRAADGTFWMPGTSQTPQTGTARYPDGFPDIDGRVWLDQLLHVTEEGTVIDRINVLDVLYENDLERYIIKAFRPLRKPGIERGIGKDVTHLNDVEPLSPAMAEEYPLFEAGDLLVSLRYLDLVFVVDPQSSEVKWHANDPFIQQHDPDFTGNGWIGIFDNNRDHSERGTTLGGSRIVSVQPHTDSTAVRYPTPQAEPFYTNRRGKWQQLENGNRLLTESMTGRVVEVAPNGETVWEWIHAPYDSSRVPVVTGGTRYDFTKTTVSTWPCSENSTQSKGETETRDASERTE